MGVPRGIVRSRWPPGMSIQFVGTRGSRCDFKAAAGVAREFYGLLGRLKGAICGDIRS